MKKMILETQLFDGTTLQVTVRPSRDGTRTVTKFNHLCPRGKISITRDEAIQLANRTRPLVLKQA